MSLFVIIIIRLPIYSVSMSARFLRIIIHIHTKHTGCTETDVMRRKQGFFDRFVTKVVRPLKK